LEAKSPNNLLQHRGTYSSRTQSLPINHIDQDRYRYCTRPSKINQPHRPRQKCMVWFHQTKQDICRCQLASNS
ncbi:MAG: hypothetical protein ACKPKO_41795, partial [Candidatus Fonsibacter sp.]